MRGGGGAFLSEKGIIQHKRSITRSIGNLFVIFLSGFSMFLGLCLRMATGLFVLLHLDFGTPSGSPVTFYLVHITIPNYNRMTRILVHTLNGNFKSSCEVNRMFKRLLLFFLYTAPYKKETKRRTVGQG